MKHTTPKEPSLLRKIITTTALVILTGGAVVGATAATLSPAVAQSPMDSWERTIDLGNGLVTYNQNELDGHPIAIGTRENCSLEFWLLPSEYQSVSDALVDYPNAKPLTSYVNKSNDWNCDRNENKKNPYSDVAAYQGFGSGITGIKAKDLANYRKA